jgi:hypothetical protein
MKNAKKFNELTEVMHVVLHDTELSADRENFSDILYIFYSIQMPGGLPIHDEIVIYEDDWEYDYEVENQDELKLSNIVNIFNKIGKKEAAWFFNGRKYEPSCNKVKGIEFVSHIGEVSEDSAKNLQEHYFETPFKVI